MNSSQLIPIFFSTSINFELYSSNFFLAIFKSSWSRSKLAHLVSKNLVRSSRVDLRSFMRLARRLANPKSRPKF